MAEKDSHSITGFIQELKGGDEQGFERAADRIWRRYSAELLRTIRARLARKMRARFDPEDVLQSAYKSFCIRQKRGDYELKDREDLWSLLYTITRNKARNAANHNRRIKRNYQREQENPTGDNGEASPLVERVAAQLPTPQDLAIMKEELSLRLASLSAELRTVALLKLAGFSNKEMAAKESLDCAERTVERKLSSIRRRWSAESDASETSDI
jgi:RNA polymerase sigma-70 factor (ECF subfamily)